MSPGKTDSELSATGGRWVERDGKLSGVMWGCLGRGDFFLEVGVGWEQ